MFGVTFVCLGLLCGAAWAQQHASSCQDLDTHSCEGFHKAKPDLCSDPNFSQTTCKRYCGNCPLECYSCPRAVTTPSDCNTTTICGSDMNCVTRHLRGTDGHHEYIMKCESKELCNLMVDGFGKRNLADGLDQERQDRGVHVELDCCTTDLCNIPQATTPAIKVPTTALPTTPSTASATQNPTKPTTTTTNKPTTATATTTAKPTTTLSPSISICHRDVVFAVQDSGFTSLHWLGFVRDIVSKMNIRSDHARVALITYAESTDVEFKLDDHTTQLGVLRKLSHLQLGANHHSRTNVDLREAIHRVRSDVLDHGNGDRHDAANAVVFLMHGASKDHDQTIYEAGKLHHEATDVITVVEGQGYDPREVNAIATDSGHVFNVNTDSDLQNIVSQILAIICA